MTNSALFRRVVGAVLAFSCWMGSPASADQFGDFTYTTEQTHVAITGYNGAGGVVAIPSTIVGLPVIQINSYAFLNRTSIISVTIPDSVLYIYSGAFRGCTGLSSATIGNGVKYIYDAAFYGCTGLTSVTIGNSVERIFGGASEWDGAFYGCTGLTSVIVPNSVESIGGHAFHGCGGLTSVTLGNSLTSIGEEAFYGCNSLTSLVIPASVTSIGERAFATSIYLTNVYFQGNAPSNTGGSIFAEGGPTWPVYYYSGTTGWGPTFAGRPTIPLGPPVILSQPVDTIALQGTNVSFTVTASGATSYQWQKNEVDIQLATSATLTLDGVNLTDATNYRVIITNPAGNLASLPATLTVIPDTDLDGLSDAEEVSLGTNPNNSDSDGDGLNDRAEIQVYLSNPLLKDSDGDGFEDGFEVSTGFNPAQANSSPDSVSTIGNAVGFRFNAGLGLSYRIEDSTDLETWTTLESPIIGAGGVVTRFYFTEGQPKRYFRVRRN